MSSPSERAREMVARIRGLPPLPAVAYKLGELLGRETTTAREVAELLGSDPAIATRVLEIANSAFYGYRNRIATLSHAVMVLGFNSVRNIVLTAGLLRSLELGGTWAPGEQQRLWRHAVATGALARTIAAERNEPTEQHMLAGLLHDVGQIVIQGWYPSQARRIAARVDEGATRREAELEALETTHEELGAELLERWQLPPLFVDAARSHHEPGLARESRTLAAIVHVADVLAHALLVASAPGEQAPRLSQEAWLLLGLTPVQVEPMLRRALSAFDRAGQLVGVA